VAPASVVCGGAGAAGAGGARARHRHRHYRAGTSGLRPGWGVGGRRRRAPGAGPVSGMGARACQDPLTTGAGAGAGAGRGGGSRRGSGEWRCSGNVRSSTTDTNQQLGRTQDSHVAALALGKKPRTLCSVLYVMPHATCRRYLGSARLGSPASDSSAISHLASCFLRLVASSLASRSHPFSLNPALYRTRYHRSMQ
jgi:hypothetical protein